MKNNTTEAMNDLIQEVRSTIPFDIPTEVLCDRTCIGCAKKLMEFLDTQLEEWEDELAAGTTPTLGDLQRLGRQCRKIYKALQKNGIVDG